jgi:hypothetical protein
VFFDSEVENFTRSIRFNYIFKYNFF